MKTGLYIHLPFCLKKCGYCDFTSFENQYDIADQYIDGLTREMNWYKGEEIDTVYLGGGTPSTLSAAQIERLLTAVRSTFAVDPNSEITMEVNPATVDLAYLQAMRQLGVNRLSIGLQSLNDDELAAIGRLHTAQQALDCVQQAQKAGFSNISVDVMFGLPNQTFDSFLDTIFTVANLDIQHISCYSLTLETGTPLYRQHINGQLNLPGEETERSMFESAVELFTTQGFQMYEISNFAKRGYQSRHNIKHWQRTPYIGLGVSASSCYRETRFENPHTFEKYFSMLEEGRNKFEVTELNEKDIQNEFLFLGLRMNEGVSIEEFKNKFGKDILELYGKTIRWYQNLGLLRVAGGRIQLTLKGMNVSNSIFTSFYE